MLRHTTFERLEPPPTDYGLTVVDVLPAQTPSEHERLVRAWAREAWEAWAPHHETVRRWVRHGLA